VRLGLCRLSHLHEEGLFVVFGSCLQKLVLDLLNGKLSSISCWESGVHGWWWSYLGVLVVYLCGKIQVKRGVFMGGEMSRVNGNSASRALNRLGQSLAGAIEPGSTLSFH
jgi:hypothetical protein